MNNIFDSIIHKNSGVKLNVQIKIINYILNILAAAILILSGCKADTIVDPGAVASVSPPLNIEFTVFT